MGAVRGSEDARKQSLLDVRHRFLAGSGQQFAALEPSLPYIVREALVVDERNDGLY